MLLLVVLSVVHLCIKVTFKNTHTPVPCNNQSNHGCTAIKYLKSFIINYIFEAVDLLEGTRYDRFKGQTIYQHTHHVPHKLIENIHAPIFGTLSIHLFIIYRLSSIYYHQGRQTWWVRGDRSLARGGG